MEGDEEDTFLSEAHIDYHSLPLNSKRKDREKILFVTRIPLIKKLVVSDDKQCQYINKNSDADNEIADTILHEKLLSQDEDGDFEISRKTSEKNTAELSLTFCHHKSTTLSHVGMQIWRASILLSDFILSSNLFNDSNCIELGCGVGVCSSILISKAKSLIATDKDIEILEICKENVCLNYDNLFSISGNSSVTHLNTRFDCSVLDWFKFSQYYEQSIDGDVPEKQKSTNNDIWLEEDFRKKLAQINIIVAADCIYDDILTEAFFKTVVCICDLSKEKRITIFISLEKRLNFTLEDMDITSPCYNHFLKQINKLESGGFNIGNFKNCSFVASQLDKNFSKSIFSERNEHLEIWKIQYNIVNKD